MRNPTFSVIVPAHNASKHMNKGLMSIRNQSFRDYELIVICDACTDNTESIAKAYSDTVLRTDYERAGLARNEGLDVATGDWILFMDDDDWWLHEFAFRQIADRVSSMNEDVLTFDFIYKGVGYARNDPRNPYIAVWNKAWRRSFIGNTRFSDEEFENDVNFANELHARARFASLPLPMYYYNAMRPGSLQWRHKNGRREA